MIISKNRKPTLEEFTELVEKATNLLNVEAKTKGEYFITRNAQKLEDDVFQALEQVAVGTVFQGSIQKISGQHFPDIVAARFFGVEVKSSKDEKWVTLGGSINESTRVPDVERIFLTFGKLTNPVEFISKPYQDCLADVVVTHYPRYKIDMKLAPGETIFDKMQIDYDVLRKKDNPTRDVIQYYKKLLKPGERLWWLDYENEDSNEIVASASAKVRLWKNLSKSEKQKFIIMAYALFPEIIGKAKDKYNNFSLWLVANYGVVLTSLRDSFSAGGKVDIVIGNKTLKLSHTLHKLYSNKEQIKAYLDSVPENILKDLWQVDTIQSDRFNQWSKIAINQNTECKFFLQD